MLTEQVGFDTCMVLYRLASDPGGRFPATLQDALSAHHHHLLQTVPASDVILSGDSAGGHIVIGLLRYLADHGVETGLPPPKGALLFSPAIDMLAPLEPENITSSRNYTNNYMDPTFLRWGAKRFVSQNLESRPYMNPPGFQTPLRAHALSGPFVEVANYSMMISPSSWSR